MTWPINEAGVSLLKEFESWVGHAYPDPMSPLGKELQRRGLWRRVLAEPNQIPPELMGLDGRPWTIGAGITEGVQPDDRMSRTEGDLRLADELQRVTAEVRRMCRIPPNENQLAALVVCAFNIGVAGIRGSTMISAHNRGDFQAAGRAFRLWDKARGQTVPGLTRRRAAESQLYLTPVHGQERYEDMPQRVDPERSLMRSEIALGSGLTGGVGALGMVGDASRTLGDMRYSLGDWLPYVLAAIAIAAAGYIIWQRYRQRRGGWA